jgi:hypothetical protein
VNTVLALGLSLVGFLIEVTVRSSDHPPTVAMKYFLIYLCPSVIGCFLLFGLADHICLYLRLYKA